MKVPLRLHDEVQQGQPGEQHGPGAPGVPKPQPDDRVRKVRDGGPRPSEGAAQEQKAREGEHVEEEQPQKRQE